jgi:hypothetical protein
MFVNINTPLHQALSRKYFGHKGDINANIAGSSVLCRLLCGIILLTHAAEFTLHSIWLLPRSPAAQATQNPLKLEQIRDTEGYTPPAEDDLRIRGDEVCPLQGNRASRLIVNLQQESPAVTVIPLAHAGQRLPAEWMEGMRHAYKTHRRDRNVCILD